MSSEHFVNFVGTVSLARGISEEWLSESMPARWKHTQQVAATAEMLAAQLKLSDAEKTTLVASAWLHDIGYTQTQVHDWHPLAGAIVLRGMELDTVANYVAWHTTAPEEVVFLGLSEQMASFRNADDVVTDCLTYSDMSSGPNGEVFTFEQRLSELKERRGEDSFQFKTMTQAWVRLLEVRDRVEAARNDA